MADDNGVATAQDDDEEMSDVEEIVTAPPLYVRPAYFRQTRKRGKIFKTVSERYIRDDLGLGCYYLDDSDPKRRAKEAIVGRPHVIEDVTEFLSLMRPCPASSLVVCDANVLLHNLDVLEQGGDGMPNIVIPQTSLMECRSNQLTAYNRTVELLRSVGGQRRLVVFFADQHHVETAHVDRNMETEKKDSATVNDINDARIRKVASFYGKQLQGTNTRVILLTDDVESRTRAKRDQKEGAIYEARSVRSWIQELERNDPTLSLSDLVAQFGGTSLHPEGEIQTKYFPPHLDAKDLSLGVQSGLYHRGVLRSSTSTDAWVTIRRGEERVAVTIHGSNHRNRAVDGDVVAIALNPVSEWMASAVAGETKEKTTDSTVGIASDTAEPTHGELNNVPSSISLNETSRKSLRPTGKVVGIIRRNFLHYCGSIYEKLSSSAATTLSLERDKVASKYEVEHADGSTTCVFFPVDTKIPPVLIRTTQRERLLGQRILVSIDSWPAHSPYPLGHYVKSIGQAGTKDVETQVFLQQHKIPHETCPAKVLACLPPADYKIDADSSPGRQDLRHLPVLSIDPPGCKDIDDALHCIVLPNGNYQVGVHIADVTHYVKAGTAIDLEAANRSTSTYLVNRRLDMLPDLLTTDLCSLKGNVDRYAFSVLWEVTPEAEIVEVDFKKTIIHSIAALTYQQAQSLIDQPDDDKDIQGAVKRLASLARKFRSRRIEAGALTLASPEVKFVLDSESLNPTDVQAYTLLEANALVEEFMLLANVTVSKKILRHYPTLSILRRHPAPNRGMFDSLISKAKSRGFEIDVEDSKRLADSLDAAQMDSDPFFNRLLRILSTRCMSPAQYFCSGEYKPTDWHHYGLAAPVYTHFTSPIRRYADVCVHRLLAAAIGVAPLPVHLSSKPYLHDLAANMNRRHRAAQLAGRASVQLHTLIFFSGEAGAKEEDAYVLDVETAEGSEPSFTVIVPRSGIEGRVHLSGISANDPNLVREPNKHRISYIDSAEKNENVSVQVFDKVRIRIWVREVHEYQKELVLDLLSPSIESKTNPTTEASADSEVNKKRRSIDQAPARKKSRLK